jgi:predicted O-methyltransferase YrrM
MKIAPAFERAAKGLRPFVPAPVRSAIGNFRRRRRRREIAMAHFQDALGRVDEWAAQRTEDSNYTYEITELSRRYLASSLAVGLGVPPGRVRALFDELESDGELRDYLQSSLRALRGRDARAAYGRRSVWYAVVRLSRPGLVVETGVDAGLGSCIIGAALLKNRAEGAPGRYLGTDIDRKAGQLFNSRFREVGEILYGDSITSLRELRATIDLFINDSDHSADYEYREYETVSPWLSARAIIIGDNCAGSDALLRFSEAAGRRFLFLTDRSQDHWYPGDAVGLSFPAERDRAGP